MEDKDPKKYYVAHKDYILNIKYYEKEASKAGKSLYITMTPAELEEAEILEPNFKLIREMNEKSGSKK